MAVWLRCVKALQRIAEEENVSVNQFINIAIAEKIAVWDAPLWEKRKRKAAAKFGERSSVLRRLAGDESPREGDEVVPSEVKTRGRPRLSRAGEVRG